MALTATDDLMSAPRRSDRPHCHICGRFAYAERNPINGQIIRRPDGSVAVWKLRCVGFDPYMGAYEHD